MLLPCSSTFTRLLSVVPKEAVCVCLVVTLCSLLYAIKCLSGCGADSYVSVMNASTTESKVLEPVFITFMGRVAKGQKRRDGVKGAEAMAREDEALRPTKRS